LISNVVLVDKFCSASRMEEEGGWRLTDFFASCMLKYSEKIDF